MVMWRIGENGEVKVIQAGKIDSALAAREDRNDKGKTTLMEFETNFPLQNFE